MPDEPKPPAPRPDSPKRRYLTKHGAGYRRHHHLGDPVAPLNGKRLCAQIHKQDHDLAAVIAVDRARCIEHGDALLQGKARTRPDLGLETGRQFDGKSGRHKRPVSGLYRQRFTIGDSRGQVGSRSAG